MYWKKVCTQRELNQVEKTTKLQKTHMVVKKKPYTVMNRKEKNSRKLKPNRSLTRSNKNTPKSYNHKFSSYFFFLPLSFFFFFFFVFITTYLPLQFINIIASLLFFSFDFTQFLFLLFFAIFYFLFPLSNDVG